MVLKIKRNRFQQAQYSMKKLFYAVAVLIAASLIAHAETRSPKGDIKANLAIFNAVVKEVQSNYVDSIDMEDVVETAIAAMLNKFDPYTEYMPRKVQEDFKVLNSGEYGGKIGRASCRERV